MTRIRTCLCLALAVPGVGCGGASPPAPAAQGNIATDHDGMESAPELNAEALFGRGLEVAEAGDFIRAEQYVVSAVAKGYPEAQALPVLLRICLASSRLRAALSYAEPYLTRNPNDWSLRYLVASIYVGLERNDRAREELERIMAVDPDRPEPHYLLAVVLRDSLGDPVGARRHFERYLELAPEGEHAGEVRGALVRTPSTAPAAPGPGPVRLPPSQVPSPPAAAPNPTPAAEAPVSEAP